MANRHEFMGVLVNYLPAGEKIRLFRYNEVMRCIKQKKYCRLPIDNVWEVHLDQGVWSRIVDVAAYYRCSFSWITRYCVFCLVREENIIEGEALKIHSENIKTIYKKRTNCHRHLMCLYGDDEMLLRITAMRLNITVSHLIRIAIHCLLPKIEHKKVAWDEIFFYGLKICRHINFKRTNLHKMPFIEQLFYEKWPPEMWWNLPLTSKIRIPVTPNLQNLTNN